MNPLMVQLLSEAEFLQTDITYNVTTDYPYLFNAVVFNYDTLEWAIVGRVHLSHQTAAAYALAFSKLFTKCQSCYSNFELGRSHVGVITDWSDAEVNGLKKFAGDKVATQLLKGCRVHWIRSWHRVRDKIIGNVKKEKQIFTKIASAITKSAGIDALNCFRVLCSQSSAKTLVNTIDLSLVEAEYVDKSCNWSAAKKWVEWWIRPQHLKMLHEDYTDMDFETWAKCPTTNAVERKNYDSKASVPLSLRNGLIMLYKIDKATCAKNITAKMGHSISYIDKSMQKGQESTEKRKIQRKRKACETASSNESGPPDCQGDFVLSTKGYYIMWYLKWYCCIFALTIRSKPSKSNCQVNQAICNSDR